MRFVFKSLLLTAFIGIMFASCDDTETYADQLKSEKALVDEYIARNNIKITNTLPKLFPWPENTYYLSTTGLYFSLPELASARVTQA